MIDRKQTLLFEALKWIKDKNVDIFSSYLYSGSKLTSTMLKNEYKNLGIKLNTEEDVEAFKKIQNEIIETVIYEIMELIDGYADLGFEVDLIDGETKESIKKNIELHDGFINYLMEVEEK